MVEQSTRRSWRPLFGGASSRNPRDRFGAGGESYNINARPLVAGKVAEILKAEKLIVSPIPPGARQERQPPTASRLRKVDELFADGTIHGGHAAKIASASTP